LCGTHDTHARQVLEPPVGEAVSPTPVIEAVEEERLWSVGALGVDSPEALLNAVFFTVGKHFV